MTDQSEVLALLDENARYTPEEIARQTEAEPEEIRATIEGLEDEGIVKGYQAVVDRRQLEQEPARAAVELNVKLDRQTSYDEIADRIARFPMVESLHLVSGDFDFMMTVEGDSMREVSAFISDKVAPVPEITQTVTHYVMDSYKEHGITFDDDRDDDRLSVSP